LLRTCVGYRLPTNCQNLKFSKPPNLRAQPLTFNSVKVNPRPARTRRLYLTVGHRTIGLNLSTGRGATAAAFERRALRRLSFRPGYLLHVRFFYPSCQPNRSYLPGRSELGLVVANPCGNLPRISTHYCRGGSKAPYGCEESADCA
jgi:hypothetical protein